MQTESKYYDRPIFCLSGTGGGVRKAYGVSFLAATIQTKFIEWLGTGRTSLLTVTPF